MDREADVFDLFAEQHRLGTVDLLVRAKHNRSLGKDLPKLFEAVQAKPVQAHLEMHVACSSARRGTRRQKARAGRKAREAKLALRWCAVQLPVPSKSSCQGPGSLQLSLVHVCEESAPDNLEPLEWFLLTSLPVTSRQQALKILEWYRLRWRIEDWHRVLKSGCKVEYLGHRTGERIERAVTHQCSHRLAPHRDDAAGPRHARAAGRHPLLRYRDHRLGGLRQRSQATTARQSRACGAHHGHAGWLAQPQR